MSRVVRAALLAAGAFGALAPAARAETLADAIALAYQTNPTLLAQRAAQRALDESYVQARAGWDPTIALTGQAYDQKTYGGVAGVQVQGAGQSTTTSSTTTSSAAGSAAGLPQNSGSGVSSASSEYNYGYGAITATQPLYTGGKVAAEVDAADASVRAGRQMLRATENTLLQNVVTAFEDVRRDQQVLSIRTEAVRVLAGQADETAAKFGVGQVTRVDVAQAQAQLAGAQSLLASARAQLQVSRAEYVAVVGQSPGELAAPPALPGMPPSIDQAFDTADASSPALLQAQLAERASRARVAAARANFRPTISAQASYGEEGALAPFVGRDFDGVATGAVVYTQPIFTGGLNGSLVRQALAQNTADRISIETTRRNVVQTVSSDWEQVVGAQASVVSDVAGLAAAQTAFSGIQEQYRVGLSTTLDVLIQQQTLESAQLSLTSARHDAYVSQAALLAAMGRLQAQDLVAGVMPYDPAHSFERVKSRGATPWEPLVAVVDRIGEPAETPEGPARPELEPPSAVTMRPAPDPIAPSP